MQNHLLDPPNPKLNPNGKSAAFDKVALVGLGGILMATVLAYHAVLFNFFCGDDFVHLTWLSRAVNDPNLIWKNFYSNWLDVPTCLFYRPLVSVFMVGDYAIWHNNGIGFHLTNLFSHLISTVMLYMVLNELALRAVPASGEKNPSWQMWALCSGALFALYPLHPEAVSWITGRVDTLVTMFMLTSFWCYLRASRTSSFVVEKTSQFMFVCALLCKEMAIMLPAIFVAVELILPKDSRRLRKGLISTIGFWSILAAYFVVRRMALGTFVGGYDDSLQPGALLGMCSSWLRAFKTMWVPLNAEIFKAPFRILWTVVSLIATALAIKAGVIDKDARRLALFILSWFLLSLVPVFKLLNIAGDLQGSRLVYLATAPLCAFLCFSVIRLRNSLVDDLQSKISRYVVLALLPLSFFALLKNNEPWRESGLQTQSILSALNEIYAKSSDNPPTYFLGLPDTINGAYAVRNALDGMTRSPQIARDARDCFALDNFDPIFPFGFAEKAIADKSAPSRVLIWNAGERRFEPFAIAAQIESGEKTYSAAELKKMIEPQSDQNRMTLRVEHMPCWHTQMIAFKLDGAKKPEALSLNYTNNLKPNFNWRNRLPALVVDDNGAHTVVFCLHGEVDWLFGGQGHQFTLVSGQPVDFRLTQMRIERTSTYLPLVFMAEKANQNRNGFIELNAKTNSCVISYDVKSMAHAAGVELEVTKPNKFFTVHNSPKASTELGLKKYVSAAAGQIALDKSDFPKDGIYQARIRAVDADRKSIGFASDHLLITVSD